MLTQIHIRDLATIEELHLDLSRNTTMITGETGAGKSIFIEAIELALGARASANLIRPNKDKAEISLNFQINDFPNVIECLKKLEMDVTPVEQENGTIIECIIRRIITKDGRSRCYVNDSPATLQFVKELGELLFHLHSQYEQQILLSTDQQREMLDRFAHHTELLTKVKSLAEQWKTIDLNIKTLREQTKERLLRRDYLRFQLDEFNSINLVKGEWEALEAEQHKLNHADELTQQVQHILQQLTHEDNPNLLSLFNEVRKTLETIQVVESKATEWLNTLTPLIIVLTDLKSDIKHYLDHIELDPKKLHMIEDRISQLFTLSRKHKIPPTELSDFHHHLTKELERLNCSDETLSALEEEQKIIAKAYEIAAESLTQSRKKAASKFAKEISETIRSLSLPHGEFQIKLEEDSHPFSIYGKEKVIFLIKTNPDQPLQAVNKVISGGELSRLSLAAHLALAHRTTIPTLVFDEVDTGLSGATAEKIGKLLRKLGDSYQVFCVTHQPQVAAYGHHHLLVEKYFVGSSTHTTLRLLTNEEKTQEIARMLGGEKMTEKTLAHAREVLQNI